MRIAGLAGLGVLLPALVAFAAPGPIPAGPRADVPWAELDIDAAVERAAEEDKRVLVYVGAPWCGACRKLESEVFEGSEGDALGERFIPLRFNADEDAGKAVRERFSIRGLPTTVVLTGEEEVAGRVVGYSGAEDWLRQIRALAGSERDDGLMPTFGRAAGAAPAAPHRRRGQAE